MFRCHLRQMYQVSLRIINLNYYIVNLNTLYSKGEEDTHYSHNLTHNLIYIYDKISKSDRTRQVTASAAGHKTRTFWVFETTLFAQSNPISAHGADYLVTIYAL